MNRYEFALVRYLHDPVGGEFANVGVVLFDADARRLYVMATDRIRRFSEFFREVDGVAFRAMTRALERSLREVDARLQQGDLVSPAPETLEEILNLVLPSDGSAIQASPIMFGVHEAPEQRLEEIFGEFVGRLEQTAGRARRTEDLVRRDFDDRIVQAGLLERVQFGYAVQAANYRFDFHTAWRNGKPQVLQSISFDLVEGRSIIDKAVDWSGRLFTLSQGSEFRFNGLIAPPSDSKLTDDFRQALAILKGAPNVRHVFLESEVADVLRTIQEDTEPAS